MSRGVEYISVAGLRNDGRRPMEHRRVGISFAASSNTADGSCTYTSGGTKVIALVAGPQQPERRTDALEEEGVVLCDVAILASSGERRRNVQRKSRQAAELASAVQRVAAASVILGQYPGSVIRIFVELMQQDGSEKAACINAAILALLDAKIALRDVVVAACVGAIDGKPLLDLTHKEARSQCPTATVAVRANNCSSIVLLEMDSRISEESLDEVVESALVGCRMLFQDVLQPALRHSVALEVDNRGVDGFVHVAH